ncbi:MAG TPA: polysaccharide biosynthesis/export family protein, partial [Blastocatellia bacterium]|nr:polysaccharide biosynthesis/export family protein [Blastocatellia bacterium]
ALIFLAIIHATTAGVAQQEQQAAQPAATPTATRPASVVVSPEKGYQIGPSDVIEVKIEDAPELSGTWEVGADGTFPMGYLGVVKAAGKTPQELQKLIADGLRGDYLKDPRVNVIVKQINSRSFFIQGSVRSPGVYQVGGNPTLLELIPIAGGLAENHGSTAFIIRKIKASDNGEAAGEEQPKYELLKVNVAGLLRGDFRNNPFIKPGDIVNIPPTDVFFVAGEVNAPGSFPLKEGTTLRQAISLAQGTSYKAATSRGVIFRESADGKRQEIAVDIGKVMSGKQEDIAIQANDTIIVPNSRLKSVTSTLLNAFGVSAARVPVRY